MAEATQDGRFMRVESGLGKDVLLLKRFSGVEAISEPFSVEVEVFATRAIKGTDVLEKPLCLVFGDEDGVGERFIHGQVRSLTGLGRDDEFHSYRLNIVPWLWFLSLYRDCRIFQSMTVTDIVEKVFSDRGYSDYRIDCTGSFGVREFTVQYGESDLAFVSRLLEEEGIFYFFEHEKDKHTLVLADHQGALTASPIQPDVRYLSVLAAAAPEPTIGQLSVESSVHTGKSVITDYHWERPSADLTAEVVGQGVGAFYDYPGRYHESRQGTRFAEIRLEAQEALAETVEGTGGCFGLIPGFRFNLKDSSIDGDYLVIEVHHQSGTQYYRSDAAAPMTDDLYRNAFTAIPYATPFRPEWRTPRPRLGVQTAVVVGPSGEEIYTDKYGRVKVRFHWDRESPKDGESSCWIRVASTWAGNKWGAFQVPRIGQEVVVEFLEGNPDRPLITGSVYNAQQMPPFGATPTQSGWKSHSSKQGSADSNELMFEDKKGSEEIHLRAEKDLKVEVVNDETVTVGRDRTTTIEHDDTLVVKNDRKATVENNETLEVQNNRTRKVAKDETVEISGKHTVEVMKDRTITVKTGDLTTKASAGKMSFEAMQSIELKVGANSIKIDQTGITMKGMMVKIEGKTMTEMKGMMTKIESQVMTEVKGMMVQVNGSAMLMAKGGISMIG